MTSQYDAAREKLISAFYDAGIRKGDTLLLHSDTDLLAELLPGGEILDQFSLLETSLRDALGENGTLLVPAFTYSFCRGRPFDPVKRNSAVGMFSNYMRRREDAYRSLHPVFSFAAVGKHAADLTADVSVYGFGKDSVFERMTKMGGKIACFNIAFQKCCTYVHHIEELHGIDYRYHKTFTGEIVIDGKSQPTTAINYVRDLERNIVSDFDAFAARMVERDVLKRAALGSGFILTYSCRETFDLGVQALSEEPHILIAKPTPPES